jgi:hypothetical protein
MPLNDKGKQGLSNLFSDIITKNAWSYCTHIHAVVFHGHYLTKNVWEENDHNVKYLL